VSAAANSGKTKELSDNDSDANEDLNFNSNNGNDFADEDSPLPTICVYGSNGMAGPLDLNISRNSDESYSESNVANNYNFSGIFTLLLIH